MWYQIISELLVNLAAGWFGVVIIDLLIKEVSTFGDLVSLLIKLGFAIISLLAAKYFREGSIIRRRN